MSVMLYPCMLCVALLMCLFVLCVACLTVFVKLNYFLLLITVLFNLRKIMATKDFLFSSLLNVCILCLCFLTAL